MMGELCNRWIRICLNGLSLTSLSSTYQDDDAFHILSFFFFCERFLYLFDSSPPFFKFLFVSFFISCIWVCESD